MHLARGRVGDEQAGAVRRDRHVIGPVALHREAPDDLARAHFDADHVGQARARDVDEAPVVGGEHVVGVLVVAFADQRADADEVAELARVERDLPEALLEVRDDVQPREPLEGVRVDDVRRAVPVVGDEQHGAGARHHRRALLGGCGQRGGKARPHGGQAERRGQAPADPRPAVSHRSILLWDGPEDRMSNA
jgi:hypothetical protein